MRVQRSRTQVVLPTWEVPAAIAASWALLAIAALPIGQAIRSWLTTGRFRWPADPVASIRDLVSGRSGDVASYTCVGATEVLVAAVAVGALVCWWRLVGPGRQYGFADRMEAASTMGVSNARRRRTMIRPDLYGRHGRVGFDAREVSWCLGRAKLPRGSDLWVPYDRTTGVYGPQGSGKTLDILVPALLANPGAALVTLTKPDDLLLTMRRRSAQGRPVAVLDPFDLVPGAPQLVWDPVVGCQDPMVAERRAKAFTAGTVRGSVHRGGGDEAARFYAAEAAKVLQSYFHAAALTGRTLDDVLDWVADPNRAYLPEEILRTQAGAAPFWDGLLRGALHGDERTAGNTITTVQQAMSLFFQPSIRRRCVPGPGRPATDLSDLIGRRGTVYLLGREDPYASASPLMTAIAEHVLDTALGLATSSPYGRLCPSFLACLDELPSTTPLPTLRTRMANERALGLSFLYAAQTWRQLVACYGPDEARSLFGLTNNLVVFGGGKDVAFYKEISDLVGTVRVTRTSYNRHRGGWGSSRYGDDVPVLRPEEIRQLPDHHALVVAGTARPLIARLTRCVDGKAGRELLAELEAARSAASNGQEMP
jgi:type IV secretion system protein VirD4